MKIEWAQPGLKRQSVCCLLCWGCVVFDVVRLLRLGVTILFVYVLKLLSCDQYLPAPLRHVLPPTQTFSVVSVMSSCLFFTKARLFSPGPAFPAHDTPFGHHFTSRSPFTLYLTQSSHTWFLLRKISMPIVVPASDSHP